jgi:CRP/FNR family transcriptional regulator, cyclic AMP receptor protein
LLYAVEKRRSKGKEIIKVKTELLKENIEIIEQLKNVSVLHSFGRKDIKQIFNFSKIKKYTVGEVVIEEGSYDNRIYFLISGEISVVKQEKEIDRLRRSGDIFGEMCVIDGSPRSASIRAVNDVTCLETDVSFMDNLFKDDKIAFCSVFYQMIAEVLACRLRETSAELVKTKEELACLKSTTAKGE